MSMVKKCFAQNMENKCNILEIIKISSSVFCNFRRQVTIIFKIIVSVL